MEGGGTNYEAAASVQEEFLKALTYSKDHGIHRDVAGQINNKNKKIKVKRAYAITRRR
jgi:hypothetical protein